MTLARGVRATSFRVAAGALALVAALGPRAQGAPTATLRALLVDVSASAGGASLRAEDVALLQDAHVRGDSVAFLAFAERAADASGAFRVAAEAQFGNGSVREHRTGATPDAAPGAGRWATALAPALRAANALRNEGERLEIVLVTDGRITDDPDDLRDAIAAVRSRGGADLRVVVRGSDAVPACVAALRGPGRAAVGETITLEASGTAGAVGATVEFVGPAGVLDSRRIDRPGSFRTSFVRVADAPGLSAWTARVRESPDAPQPAARVVVVEPGATLLMSDGAPRAPLVAALGRLATHVDLSRGASQHDVRALLDGHDAVIVDDADPRSAGEAIRAFVARGGGLLLLGGPRRAAFVGDPRVADVSPLGIAPPEDGSPSVYLAIDGSGSMAEPWPGDDRGRGVARDAAARAAADALVRVLPTGTSLHLRRFRDRLVPDGATTSIRLSDDARRDAASRAVRDLPGPGGSTAFLPVLAEAFDTLAASPESVRVAIFLSDGRSSEPQSAVDAALRRVLAAGIRVAVVVPGALPADVADATLLGAARGTETVVRAADDASRLGEMLVEAERGARTGEPFLTDRALEVVPGSAPAIGRGDVPSRAARLVRTFAASAATTLVRTTDGVPVAALRREGAGVVGAIAAQAADASWFDDDGGAALVGAMLRFVRRSAAHSARAEREGRTLLVRVDGPPSAAPVRAALSAAAGTDPVAVPLRAGPQGAYALDLPATGDFARATLESEDGAEVAAVGLDRAGAAEATSPPVADFSRIADLLRGTPPDRSVSLRPWLAGAALVLLVLGEVKSSARRTR